ncbi:MAG: membrane dipeptidase [Parvularculaceae bacterium]|nr:membrane dipeptidase [Parvularculaceae bacterium]
MRLKSSAIACVLLSSGAFAAPLEDPALEARARAIHERAIALDTHVDIPLDFATAAVDPGGFTKAQVDLPKMRAGGLDAAFFIVYTPQGPLTEEGFQKAREIAFTRLAAIHRFVGAYPKEIALATSAAEARKIAKSGRKVAFIGMENSFPLGPEPTQADIDRLRSDGVRYAGIAHFGHNQFGDSSNPHTEGGDPDEKWGGLSPQGRELVAMLNRAGIMVDVSHSGRNTMMQAIEASKAPIIASHSGVKAIADSPRNLDDEQLKALAENGGVAQIVALDVYVKPLNDAQKAVQEKVRKEMGLETSAARAAMSAEVEAAYNKRLEAMWEIEPRASVADFVNHIEHAAKIAGIDHVGIASDFDGGGGLVGWEDASETLNVTRELVRRGYSDEAIEKLWSGNLLRVLAEVEKTAKMLAKE